MKKGIGILLVGIVLIIASIGNATIRLGNDGTGQLWFGDDTGLIINSNGKAWTPTHANIQLALYDLNGTGGWVDVPDGTYVGTTIYMVNNTKLMGNGNNTQIVSEGGTDANCITILNVNNVEIAYLYLDGNESNQADHARGILISQNDNSWKTENILIHHCTIVNTYRDGIEAYPSTELLTVRDCYFYDCGHNDTGYEAAITSRGLYSILSHNYIQDGLGYGIVVETTSSPARRRAGYTVIDSNIIEGTNLSGIHLEGGDSSFWCSVTNNVVKDVVSTVATGNANGITACASNTVVANNIIENVIGKGIVVDTGGNEAIYNVTVSNNIISNVTTYDGIFIRGSGCIVEGNVIYNTVQSGIFCYESDCYNITINDNTIDTANTAGGSNDGGIYVDTTCGNGFTISGNSITNTKAKGIRGSASSIITDNQIINMVDSGGVDRAIYFGRVISNNILMNNLEYGIQASADSLITGNVIDTVTSDGIYMTTNNNLISNNYISNCAVEDIDDDGTNNIISDNFFDTQFTDNTETMIKNSNGKAWTATGANIQNAIDDLDDTINGGFVILPVGEFTCNIEITEDGISLRGQGNETRIIRAGTTNPAIEIEASDITIEYLNIYGNHTGNSGTSDECIEIADATTYTTCNNVVIRNCRINGSKSSLIIMYNGSTNCIIENNWMGDTHDKATYPAAVYCKGNYNKIINNFIEDSYGNGIVIEGANRPAIGNQIIGNHIRGAIDHGIHCEPYAGGSWHCNKTIISNNHVFNLTDTDVYSNEYGIIATRDYVVDGNFIYNLSTHSGIYAPSTCNGTITNNNIFDVFGEGIQVHTEEGAKVLIDGNHLNNISWHGIRVVGDGRFAMISNNILENIGWYGTLECYGIRLAFYNGIIQGNFINNTDFDAINLTSADNVIVDGNYIWETGGDGLNLTNSDNCIITSNFIRGCDNWAIIEYGAADENIIAMNNADGTVGDIKIIGANTVNSTNIGTIS